MFINYGQYLDYLCGKIRILVLLTFLHSLLFFFFPLPTSVSCTFILALPNITTFNFYHKHNYGSVTCLWLDSTFINANIYCGLHELIPVLGAGETAVNTIIQKNPALVNTLSSVGRQKRNKEVRYLVC